jgi:hypothetical protein
MDTVSLVSCYSTEVTCDGLLYGCSLSFENGTYSVYAKNLFGMLSTSITLLLVAIICGPHSVIILIVRGYV